MRREFVNIADSGISSQNRRMKVFGQCSQANADAGLRSLLIGRKTISHLCEAETGAENLRSAAMITNDLWTPIGEAANQALRKIAKPMPKDALSKHIHKRLKIPEGYYKMPRPEGPGVSLMFDQSHYEPVPPKISLIERGHAISDLIAFGKIKGGSTDDLLEALCERLGRLA